MQSVCLYVKVGLEKANSGGTAVKNYRPEEWSIPLLGFYFQEGRYARTASFSMAEFEKILTAFPNLKYVIKEKKLCIKKFPIKFI
jgi:hypothetical protein